MARDLAVEELVYVPKTALGLDPNVISPFHQTRIRELDDRSVKVDMPDGSLSDWIGSSRITRRLGVFLVRIGDFDEDTLIEPLSKSVLHFCRILLPGDCVRVIEVRSLGELTHFWSVHHNLYEQVVLVGHGSANSILFGRTNVSPSALADSLAVPGLSKKEIISLCCQTGRAEFAKPFSKSGCCSNFVAPFDSIHGCVASLFVQNYLTNRLLQGLVVKTAFSRARKDLLGAASFRLWDNGTLKEDPR